MAAQYDLEIYQGSDFSIQFQFVDLLGQPLDLTQATVASQIRDYAGNLVASFTTTSSTAGSVIFTLPRNITLGMPTGRNKYNVVIRLDNSDEVVLEGSAVVREQITVIV
jgi:hypothetical protein